VIKPAIGELLSGVATSLRERVLPEIPPGTTRRQIQAAIGIISRVALVWDKTGPYLYADNEDIVQTLGRILPLLERESAHDGTPRIATVCANLRDTLKRPAQPAQPYPSAGELGARNLELQEVLADIQEALHETSPTALPENSHLTQHGNYQEAPREQALLGNAQGAHREHPAGASADRDELKSILLALFRRMLTRELEITRPRRRP
jgi:hypothetical protein